MPLTNPYCLVADVRSQLTDADSKLDAALIERAINATSRAIDRYCGRRFWQDATVQVRTYRPDDPCMARVDDISTATGLLVATDTGDDGVFETSWTIGTDFQLEPLNASADGGAFAWTKLGAVGTKRFVCSRWSRRPTLQVSAKFGWSAVPDDVNEAAILKAVSLFRRKDAPFGVAGFSEFGPVRITRRDPDVVDLLAPFQRPMVA